MRKLIEAGVACVLLGCSAGARAPVNAAGGAAAALPAMSAVADAGVAPSRSAADAGAGVHGSGVTGAAGVAGAARMQAGGGAGSSAANSSNAGAGASAQVATAGAAAPSGKAVQPCEPVPAGRQLAFPGAEGFGRYARGGRGGDVCHVTQLGDKGAGSLRECVSRGDRTVVFDVSGWITLASNLGITVNNLTLAGQSAPEHGVGIRGAKLSLGGNNLIMRFLRVRRGTITTTDRNDAMAVSSAAHDVIVDHCSVMFGTDENLSMPGDEGVGPRDLTVQWSIIAWGLQRNNHSAGSLLTASNTTIHHSLYAFNGTRNPKVRSEDGRTLDFVNNVVYGWNAPDPVGEEQGWSISKQPFILADSSNGVHKANAVGNYFIAHGQRAAEQAFVSGAKDASGQPTFQLYFEDNLLDGNANGKLDVSSSDFGMVGTATRLPARLEAPHVCTDKAPDAQRKVIEGVGAVLPQRDEVDTKLLGFVAAQSGDKLQNEKDLGVGADGYGDLPAGKAPQDTDADGMPDAWETQHGLDPKSPEDRNGDVDNDGYTNLEAYLNELVP